MKILYIDTSSSYLYSAIISDTEVITEIKENLGHTLSEKALPKIVSMFSDNKIDPEEINKIIVVDGPGSFTGIRIGITIAKVYSWALNIPITTISALEAMALSIADSKIHIPLIDARRNYVYAAIYDSKMKAILKPQHIKITELQEKIKNLNEEYEIITNDELSMFETKEEYNPNILKIVQTFKNKKSLTPHAVNPNYLKLTEAEEKNN